MGNSKSKQEPKQKGSKKEEPRPKEEEPQQETKQEQQEQKTDEAVQVKHVDDQSTVPPEVNDWNLTWLTLLCICLLFDCNW